MRRFGLGSLCSHQIRNSHRLPGHYAWRLEFHRRHSIGKRGRSIASHSCADDARVRRAYGDAFAYQVVTASWLTFPFARWCQPDLYCGRFERGRFEQVDWASIDPLEEISHTPGALIERALMDTESPCA